MDKELYAALSSDTAVQAGWKGRQKEYPQDRKLRRLSEEIVKELDAANRSNIKALSLDKKADALYDKDKRLRA